jgi:hypothetical protein
VRLDVRVLLLYPPISMRERYSSAIGNSVATLNTPIPGSVQHAEAARWGSLDETDWGQFNYWRPVFVPRGLDAATLLAKQRELYRRFYLRPRVVWRYARSFASVSGLRRLGALGRSLPFLLPGRSERIGIDHGG